MRTSDMAWWWGTRPRWCDQPRPDPDGLFFVAPQGGRLRRDQWSRRVLAPAVKAAGIDHLTYHGLRHFYASTLLRSGLSAVAVARRLGNTPARVLEV